MLELTAKALLFDIDGTLIDSIGCIDRTWLRWSLSHNINPDRVMPYVHGRTITNTLEHVSPQYNCEKYIVEVQKIALEELRHVKAIDGALQLLHQLSEESWAVVTSAQRSMALYNLNNAGLPPAKIMICAEDILYSKPNPEPYLTAARLLNVAPADCIVFEDADAGITAALAAGCQAISINYQSTNHSLRPQANIRDYNQLDIKLIGQKGEQRFKLKIKTDGR